MRLNQFYTNYLRIYTLPATHPKCVALQTPLTRFCVKLFLRIFNTLQTRRTMTKTIYPGTNRLLYENCLDRQLAVYLFIWREQKYRG